MVNLQHSRVGTSDKAKELKRVRRLKQMMEGRMGRGEVASEVRKGGETK